MPPRAPIVALEGPSAAGKSTVAAALQSRHGWAIVAEAADRLDPPPSLRFADDEQLYRLERRLLEEDARRFRTAREIAARGTAVVADTGFVGTVSYTAGLVATGDCRPTTYVRLMDRAERLARHDRLGMADLSVVLRTSPRVRAERAAADPERHPPEFWSRHEEVGRFEAGVFWPWLTGRLPGRVVEVRASGRPERIAGRISVRATGVALLRQPSGTAARVLARLRAADLPAVGPRPRQLL